MFKIEIKGIKELEKQLAALPGKVERAAKVSLNKTGKAIKEEVVREMKSRFDKPTRYTLNSLQLTPAKEKMEARVGFRVPERMSETYLAPQIEGGHRKTKGFERALDNELFVPGKFARMTPEGNVSTGQIRQILSVLGRAEVSAGYMANLTARSAKRNKKDRDYVWIRKRHGRLIPGIYQRFQTGVGFGAKTKRTIARFGAWQQGNRKVAVRDPRTGRIVRWVSPASRIQSIVRAKGLRPIMVKGRKAPVKPLLPFYEIAQKVAVARFKPIFHETMEKFLKS